MLMVRDGRSIMILRCSGLQRYRVVLAVDVDCIKEREDVVLAAKYR